MKWEYKETLFPRGQRKAVLKDQTIRLYMQEEVPENAKIS